MTQQLTREPPKKRGESKRKLSAFILDDDPLMMELLGMLLRKRSYEAVIYHDPHRLLEDVRSSSPDVVLSDLDMPVMDGIELTRKLRADGFKGAIVIITAEKNRDKLKEVFSAGADEVISKPVQSFEIELLTEKLKKRATKHLSDEDIKISDIIEHLEEGVIILKDQFECVMANSSAREMLGGSSNEDLLDILSSSCSLQVLCSSDSSTFVEIPAGKAGKAILIGIESHILSSGNLDKKVMLVLSDFSRWKKMDELHTKFATYISHEIRTPLTSAHNALKILLKDECPEEEKEKFIEIANRNLERLTVSLDEIQRLFMVDGDKLSICRQLLRLRPEVKAALDESRGKGRISGYKLKARNVAVVTARSKLRDFIESSIEAISRWLGVSPYIECKIAISEVSSLQPATGGVAKILIKAGRKVSRSKLGLKEFLSMEEAHSGTLLARIADTLGGDLKIEDSNEIKLYLPLEPSFDREKDLINPMKFMGEKSELEGSELVMAHLKLVGAGARLERFRAILKDTLISVMPDSALISLGSDQWDFNIFLTCSDRDRVEELFRRLVEKFNRSCVERWEEIHPSLKWEVAYRKEHGESSFYDFLKLNV